jgi:hypothetical protein
VLISWKNLALPKAFGGWGLKNTFLFSKALAEKNVWRLIQGTGLWAHVVRAKYIAPNSMEDWIKSPIKQQNNASIIQKIYYLCLPSSWKLLDLENWKRG